MKIAIVGINYAPEPTGIPVYTTGLAEYLAGRNAAVTVYAGFPYYPAWRKREGDGGRLYRRDRVGPVTVRRSYVYVPSRPTPLKRIVHELSFVVSASLNYLFGPRADCTLIVSPPLLLGIPVLLIAKLKRSRTIFHVQDLQPDAAVDLGMLKRGTFTRMLFGIEYLTYRWSDYISTISEGMLDKIASKGISREKLLLFRNWANDDKIVPMSRDTALRNDHGLHDKFVVLYSGNMGVKQGLDVLLETARLLQETRDIVFVIVGDGGEKEHLVRRAQTEGIGNVIFLPVQPYEKLSELLATADVSVIPQKKGVHDIVLPSKLGNIMASQRPIVAAAQEGSEFCRIIKEADCGILVDAGEPVQLAEAIMQLHGSPELCERLGRNGRRYMQSHLGHRAILDEFFARLGRMVKV
jgi:colanic acid biosynthesis glycosyl transferase WcaI